VPTFSADCLSVPRDSTTCNIPATFHTSTTKDMGDQVKKMIEIRQTEQLQMFIKEMNCLNPVKKRPPTSNDNIRSVCTQQKLTGKIDFTFIPHHLL
jgi:hypothetical protein